MLCSRQSHAPQLNALFLYRPVLSVEQYAEEKLTVTAPPDDQNQNSARRWADEYHGTIHHYSIFQLVLSVTLPDPQHLSRTRDSLHVQRNQEGHRSRPLSPMLRCARRTERLLAFKDS